MSPTSTWRTWETLKGPEIVDAAGSSEFLKDSVSRGALNARVGHDIELPEKNAKN